MSAVDRRGAARANQRAAAFIRFQLLGDHQAMHYVLTETVEDDAARLAFVAALASIASTLATATLGRDRALEYLQAIAHNSAALCSADDIDRFFD
ncbi:MAG: hypothetical protein GXX79_15410 [Actinomycetales bacterium]|nr:hypothetical protein [Actinomycetales bacterium]